MRQPKLVITAPNGNVQEVLLADGSLTIGRASANDIALSDARVSRLHATISAENGTVSVSNESRTNSLRLNRLPIASSQLANGDVLSIGNHTARLVIPAADSAEEAIVLNSEDELEQTLLQTIVDTVPDNAQSNRLTITTPNRTWEISLEDDVTIGRDASNVVTLDLLRQNHGGLFQDGDVQMRLRMALAPLPIELM